MPSTIAYILPDGRTLYVPYDVCKAHSTIDYTLADGRIVLAVIALDAHGYYIEVEEGVTAEVWSHANARLIAAAREMLIAFETADSVTDLMGCAKRLREAIQRAEVA